MCKPIIKHSNQQGAALLTAIFAILLATLIGTALHYIAKISLTIAVNERDNTEAFYIAEAGINHAKALIGKVKKTQYSLVLIAGTNPLPGTGDELSVPPVAGLWQPSESIPAGRTTSGGVTNFGAGGNGRYWVTIKNDTATGETAAVDKNGILIVTSTGIGRDGASAIIELTVKSFPDLPAVLINGKATISGNVKVEGTNGILHANDTLVLNGNPCADVYFSTSADVTNPTKLKGSKCVGSGAIQSSQPIIEPPIYDIRNNFYGETDYILGANGTMAGKVFTGAGVLVNDVTKNGNKWVNGSAQWLWSPTDKEWTQTGNILNASFYSEGNISIKGNFGTSLNPAKVSFIAEGYISVEGKQYMIPKYQNFTMIAGTDLKLSGKLDELDLSGLAYALHQIDFSGNPTIRGNVIAANQADTASPGGTNLVPLDGGFMNLSGNPTIISNNSNTAGIMDSVWREVRR